MKTKDGEEGFGEDRWRCEEKVTGLRVAGGI